MALMVLCLPVLPSGAGVRCRLTRSPIAACLSSPGAGSRQPRTVLLSFLARQRGEPSRVSAMPSCVSPGEDTTTSRERTARLLLLVAVTVHACQRATVTSSEAHATASQFACGGEVSPHCTPSSFRTFRSFSKTKLPALIAVATASSMDTWLLHPLLSSAPISATHSLVKYEYGYG